MEINLVNLYNSNAIVSVKGQIDAKNSLHFNSTLDEIIDKHNIKSIIFVMDDVFYISSAGVGVFIKVHTTLRKQGGKIVFVGTSENIKRIFEKLGFASLFNHYDTLESAQHDIE